MDMNGREWTVFRKGLPSALCAQGHQPEDMETAVRVYQECAGIHALNIYEMLRLGGKNHQF